MRSTIHSMLLACAVSAAIAACSDAGTEADEDMNRELDVAYERASAIDQELSSHESAVSAATDVSAIEGAERTHGTMMAGHMDGLDHVLADMSMYCRHRMSEERGRTHEMQGAMRDLRAELDRHRPAPGADLAAARSEENTHLAQSRAAMNRLAAAGNAMRHEAGFYRCAHGNH